MRLAKYSASKANSTAAARWPSDFAPRRSCTLAIAGTSGTTASTSRADTRSPVVTADAALDRDHQRPDVDTAEQPLRGVGRRAPQQMLEHRLLAALLTGLELQLAAQHVDHRAEVDHARHRVLLAEDRRAVPRRSGDRLRRRDREPRRHTRTLVDRRRLTQVAGEAREDLQQVLRHLGRELRLLADDADLGVQLQRVVGADLRAEAVLQRGDDPPAVGVVLGVGAGDDHHVERQPQRVAAHLDVALLHHVEHRHLDALGEVGQLVDRDDAAVRPRDEPEGDGLGVAEAAALGHLDRVDVADQVGHAGVGGGQLLEVALAAVPPLDGQILAGLGGPPDRLRRDRRVRVLAELRPRDHRRPFVEQAGQRAQQSGLALTAFAEQHHVVARDQRPLELRKHGVLEAEDSGPYLAALGQRGQQVLPDFLFDAPLAMAGGTQLADGAGQIVR